MNREARRRLSLVAAAAAVGVASPLWGPVVLRSIPALRVSRVEFTGTRFVDPAAARALASVPPDASVWDDHSAAESRLRLHPLVEDVRIRRSGLTRLTVDVREIQPVALVATPVLQAVDARGYVLPLDPAQHRLDLPILQDARVESDRVVPEGSRRALAALERLGQLNRDFVERVSEVRHVSGESIELLLLEGSHAGRVLLPTENTELAFLRVESALRECSDRGRIRSVDGRFRDRVFVDLEDGA
jgi:cell division septal protein FtsQ